ncbi:C40 family peptidase [Rhodococcus erythropolis]|uniref:C40 family peptidase n=1 Tax=Rhodococcus erythropolis TaxID=1833 RepID=UPI00083FC60D|nr:C40 family peptidase [Rhodococcus erythropolis]MDJ0108516.1 C40 family peptidase [Rhodococcus erythropolis]
MSHHRFTSPRTTKIALGRALVIGALSLTTLAVSIDTANAQAPLLPDWNTAGVSVVTNPAKVSAFASSDGGRALAAAESKIGAPYVWGATGPDSFDCSGLVQWAYAQAGVSIPRTTYDQAVGGAPISRDDLQPGDVVLYYGGEHVGIYAGGGEVLHAPTSGESVKRAPVDSMPYYLARRY